MTTPPAIKTTGLTKVYNGVEVLSDLNLEVAAGEVLGYLGPNGAAGHLDCCRADHLGPARGGEWTGGTSLGAPGVAGPLDARPPGCGCRGRDVGRDTRWGFHLARGAAQHTGLSFPNILGAGLNTVPAGICLLGIGALVWAVVPRLASAGVYAVLAWSFLVELLGGIVNSSHWLLDTSILHQLARRLPPRLTG